METDVVVRRVADGLRQTLRRLASLATGVALFAAAVGLATFATGLWIFKGSGRPTWIVIGGTMCALPVVAALIARFLVLATARQSPALIADVREFIASPSRSATVLIDHDSGQSVSMSSKSFATLRDDLTERRKELPALFAGVRAVTRVPGLAAIAVLGVIGVGGLGTILLIGGVID